MQHKKYRFACVGYIELYNDRCIFIAAKKYKSKLHRQKIINIWAKIYAFHNITYYLIIKPIED